MGFGISYLSQQQNHVSVLHSYHSVLQVWNVCLPNRILCCTGVLPHREKHGYIIMKVPYRWVHGTFITLNVLMI